MPRNSRSLGKVRLWVSWRRAVISRNGAKSNGASGTQVFVNGDDETDRLALLSVSRELTDQEAMRLEDELNELSEEYGYVSVA